MFTPWEAFSVCLWIQPHEKERRLAKKSFPWKNDESCQNKRWKAGLPEEPALLDLKKVFSEYQSRQEETAIQ